MQPQARGFTLIELLTAILVVSILFAVAMPSFQEMGRTNRISAAQNDLVTAINVARSEALRRGLRVSVCSSTTGTGCDGNNNWATGWIVLTDEGAPGTLDGTDEILQTWPAVQGDTTLATDTPFIRYANSGMLFPLTPRDFFVSYTGCSSGTNNHQVTVSAVGFVTATALPCP